MKFLSRVPKQLRSIGRFPVPVAMCVALTVLLNLQIAGFIAMSDRFEGEVIFASVAAALAALIAALWSDTHRLSAIAGVIAGLAAAAVAASLQFSHGEVYTQDVVVVGGLILATIVAAHLRRGATLEAFWQFGLQLGIAAVMGVVALVIVCGGLSLLLESFRYLFDIPIADTTYEHIWTTGASLLGPLFALAMIPTDADEAFVAGAKPDLMEKAVSYVLNFALAPLVLVYAVMIHIYAAKIAVTANMPKGEVGHLVLAFGIIGTVTYMIAYPWREVGFRPVRWFMRSWFWLMVIPMLLLTLAVWQRIAEYGVTPERYFLCLFAIWLLAMAIYMGVAGGNMDLRAIPASVAVALLASSFGPWGAASVSIRSQLGEFHRLLESRGVLVDGRLKLEPPRVEKFARLVASNDQLRSILGTLESLDALNRIEFVFAGANDDPFLANPKDERLRSVLGMNGAWQLSEDQAVASLPVTGVESHASIALNLDVGYDLLVGPIWVNRSGQVNVGVPDSPPGYGGAQVGEIGVMFSDPVLTVSRGRAAVSFNLAKAIEPGKQTVRSPIVIPAHEGRERAIALLVRPSEIASVNDPSKFEMWLLLNTKTIGTP
ncbi:DUF4153 domain-containing protein [Candidatus Binatus sp.]|uniref:DUF4153 domain-containing protein n=1 Tax=Candidatus Binatus sp. TaxID=2811406 RepID=UPI003C6FDA7F